MSLLLREIREIDSEAASILEDENIRTDSDIRFLNRQDLHDLFPGKQQFKRRKIIFDTIHKQKPVDVLREEQRDFIPLESLRAAQTGNSVLVDHLHILKKMKTQMDNVQAFLDAHINLLEDITEPGPYQELQNRPKSTTSATTGPGELSKNQPHDHQQGAHGSNSIASASIGPVEHYLNQPHERQQLTYGSKSTTSSTGGQVEPGLNQPHDYRHGAYRSKSTTSSSGGQVEPGLNQPHDYQHGAYRSKSITSVSSGQGKPDKTQTDLQRAHGSSVPSCVGGEKSFYVGQTGNIFRPPSQHLQEVKYRVVISGQTFGADVQLMDRIKAQSLDRKLHLVESDQEPQIIFVFCPIVSRLATDANAALDDVKVSTGDASIILVLMHHVHEVKCVTNLRTWDENKNVKLHVHVFYHERVHGLLTCKENRDVVSQIQSKLLEMYPCKRICANAEDKSSTTDSLTGGGDSSGSQNDAHNNSVGSYFRRFPSVSRWLPVQK